MNLIIYLYCLMAFLQNDVNIHCLVYLKVFPDTKVPPFLLIFRPQFTPLSEVIIFPIVDF